MDKTLIFVDKPLSIAIAANLVGVLSNKTRTERDTIGTNWLLNVSITDERSNGQQHDIRELLPEDLIYYFDGKVKNRFTKISEALPKLTTGHSGSLIPGNVISLCGKITFPEINLNPDIAIETDLAIKQTTFHGEDCIMAELIDDNRKLPLYLPVSSKYQVVYCHNQPVEILGILRWTPPYSPGGAASLNLAIRVAAIWLR